jgi:trimethylamine---corrinoid protein Co-methyltransferase
MQLAGLPGEADHKLLSKILALIEVLDKSDLEEIHHASMQLLDQTGVVFHSEEARLLMQFHGARVEGKRVFIPAAMVEKALQSCPAEFTIKSRNPDKSVSVGGGTPALEATRGTVFIADSIGRRRKATTEDFINLTKLVQTSDLINLNCGGIALPADLNQESFPAFSMICSALYTDKPLAGLTSSEKVSKECLHLAEVVHGGLEDNMVLGTICPLTPLSYDASDLASAFIYARSGQPLCITSCAMAGTTAPPTLAGTLAVNNAEILAGIVLVQLIKVGIPVVYGNLSSITDMRHINMAVGAPEGILLQLAALQIARYYRLPFRGGGALNDAKGVDFQAGFESMMNLMLLSMAGFDYVPHAIGVLDSYMSISYEKFIMDEQMLMAVRRLQRGIEVNSNTLLTGLAEKIGPGGNFFATDETAFYFRREYWQPSVDLRQPQSLWESAGAPDVANRAMEFCRRRIDGYTKPGIAPAVEAKLLKYFKDHYGQAESLQTV